MGGEVKGEEMGGEAKGEERGGAAKGEERGGAAKGEERGGEGRRGKRKRASWTLLFRIVRAQFMERGASTEEGGGEREK
ncbi:hypothetical protein Pcinc_035518 [Petrolisthes cinctipes]|uniref:Uncharacterized protein n=1 Tax=Petrolisthes cinctipes TaxID=88211 RepID=A0AAE1BWT7_PETCI|nr:hypothetical protein Pcinc_035518 [Petrolisthes cinctipes]